MGWDGGGGPAFGTERAPEPSQRMGDWYTAQEGSRGWPGGVQGIAPAGERSEWTKSTDMATIMWATLRVDGFKPPYSSGKDVMVLTATAFELDKKTAEAVANLAGLDIMDIAFKSARKGGGKRMAIIDRIDAFAYLIGLLATAAVPVLDPRGMGAMQRLQRLKAS